MALTMRFCFGAHSKILHLGRPCSQSFDAIDSCICRCLSSSRLPDHDHVSPPGRLKIYLVNRFVRYVERYETILQKRYPKVYKVYKVFTVGMKEFLVDARSYYTTSTSLWAGESLNSFTWRQLEIYRQMPRDLFKMSPLLLATALPLVPYALFPIVYHFPKYFLTSHFWSTEQRTEFQSIDHKHRVQHYPAILDYLHNQCRHIDKTSGRDKVETLLEKLENSQHLSVAEIWEIRSHFQSYPYHVDRLAITHLRHLARSLGMSVRRSRLVDEAILLQHIDKAMVEEGLDKLSDQELERACFARGLNPIGMKREEQLAYLTQWTKISLNLDDECISLLLHSPVLLGYNHPTNRLHMTQKLRWRKRS